MHLPELHVFGRHTSYNVQKVLWLLDELALQYRHTQVGGRFGGNDSAEFLAMNPHGKVPVLQHGHRILWESNTIVRYLASEFSDSGWISAQAFARSLEERWMDWSIEKLEPAFVGVFWGYYRTPAAQRNPARIEKSVRACQDCLQMLDGELEQHDFLVGSAPSVADIATAVFLHRLVAIELEIDLPRNVWRWYQQLSKRPAYAKWVMSDFSELRARTGY